MRFVTVLSGVPVADLAKAVAWYSLLLGRPPDLRPLPDVAEWFLNTGATLQLVERPATAGTGLVRLEVEDLDVVVADASARELEAVEASEHPGVVRYAQYHDPFDNAISIVQALFDVPRFAPHTSGHSAADAD